MSAIERWFGLDDSVARDRRAPLWKRAAWHALKTLVKRHPGAAVGAAGAGLGYAVTHGVSEGAQALKDNIEAGATAVTETADAAVDVLAPARGDNAPPAKPPPPVIDGDIAADEACPPVPSDTVLAEKDGMAAPITALSDAQKQELVESLPPEDRAALRALARKARG